MSMEVGIGEWVMREHYGIGHLVESLIAGDAVTRCGRRMTDRTTGGLLLVSPFGTRKCRKCTSTTEASENE